MLTARDLDAVAAMRNFMSWDWEPVVHSRPQEWVYRGGPPAIFAYVMGLSSWCPPKGEL